MIEMSDQCHSVFKQATTRDEAKNIFYIKNVQKEN